MSSITFISFFKRLSKSKVLFPKHSILLVWNQLRILIGTLKDGVGSWKFLWRGMGGSHNRVTSISLETDYIYLHLCSWSRRDEEWTGSTNRHEMNLCPFH